MAYRVVVHRRAARYLRKLPPKQQSALKRVLNQLQADPAEVAGIKRLAGEWQGYSRVRVGSLRVIFWIDDDADTIYVDHLGPRGDVYR